MESFWCLVTLIVFNIARWGSRPRSWATNTSVPLSINAWTSATTVASTPTSGSTSWWTSPSVSPGVRTGSPSWPWPWTSPWSSTWSWSSAWPWSWPGSWPVIHLLQLISFETEHYNNVQCTCKHSYITQGYFTAG